METSKLGETGLEISRIGIGLAEIGFHLTREEVSRAAEVLNTALDSGITFLDTAGCYNVSEELIGETVSARRDEYVLASKTGHMKEGCGEDSWSYECVTAGIERSLRRLKTDHIDLMQLHSCDVDVLERGDAIRALQDARVRGLVDFIGYSGDNEAAVWAAESEQFDVIQTSFSIADQGARRALLAAVRSHKLGLIAKRPIANGVWRREEDPDPYGNGYSSEYFRRQAAMGEGGPLPGEPEDRIIASLGFTLAHPEVTVAIVGTRNPAHLRSNVEMLASLPVPESFVAAAHERFDTLGADWPQLI
jgi:aryl-alcohol dehydrogenase-like predicted oxidoreductase